MTTAASFAPQRDETWTLYAHRLLNRLRVYEDSHPHDTSPCLMFALRAAEEACDLTGTTEERT